MSIDDKYFMHEAMLLAENGRGFVSPNPLVGAVIVKNNKIIGRGYHKKFGDAHAEVNAFKNAKESVKGAKLYVTLEPCNYLEKKTPPCVPAIINAGIKEVVIGTLDCNPRVCNKGVADLRKAGIKVKVGVMRKEIEQQNESYLKYSQTNKPFVILKLGLSLDGRIATSSGESKWITSPQSRKFGQEIRKQVDAILVGINTILKDNPKLSCRIAPWKTLIRVILDPNLTTPPHANVLKGICPILIFADKNSRSVLLSEGKNLEVIRVDKDQEELLSWDDILSELAKRNIASVLIEGGAQVASSALQSGVVDKLYLIYAPKILGKGISFSDYLRLDGLKSALKLKDYKISRSGKDFILEAYVHRHN